MVNTKNILLGNQLRVNVCVQVVLTCYLALAPYYLLHTCYLQGGVKGCLGEGWMCMSRWCLLLLATCYLLLATCDLLLVTCYLLASCKAGEGWMCVQVVRYGFPTSQVWVPHLLGMGVTEAPHPSPTYPCRALSTNLRLHFEITVLVLPSCSASRIFTFYRIKFPINLRFHKFLGWIKFP